MALKKSDIAAKLVDEKVGRRQAALLLERALEIIKSTLEKGEDILISGFGKFMVHEKRSRKGRNPVTGERMELGARRVVSFRPAPRLKDLMNSPGDSGHGAERPVKVPRIAYVCDVCGERHCICHRAK